MKKLCKRFSLRADVRAVADRKGEIRITSEIGPWKWDDDTVTGNDIHSQLETLGDVDEITVRINSPGGDVHQAVAIRTELMRHKATKLIEIEGLCASAATIIACMPGAKVRMSKGSEYMIHRCYYGAYGHADDLLAAYNSMVVTDRNLAEIYAERTGKSVQECAEMMEAETWMSAQTAIDEGFADEIQEIEDDNPKMVACAMSREEFDLMKECYANMPEDVSEPVEEISNGETAVAAGSPTEINTQGVEKMDELKNATAEQLRAENPDLAASIAQEAVKAERERMQKIDKLTPKGAKFAAMAKKAKAEGTSVQDYLEMVIEAQEKSGDEYLEARAKETEKADNVGGGDCHDNDEEKSAKLDTWAKEIADLASGMSSSETKMA